MMITALLAVIILPTSCIEEPESEVAGKGQNRFRVPAGNFSLIAFNAAIESRPIIEIFRDVNSNASLNESASLTMTLSPTALEDYNVEHETEFEMLPTANYTLTGIEGTNVNFGAGEFSKVIGLNLNPAGLDFSKQYALAYVLSNPSNNYGISATQGDVIVTQITVKNAFDGNYTVAIGQSGWTAFGIYDGPPIDYPGSIAFATSGATVVAMENNYTGTTLFPGFSVTDGVPGATQFGAITPVLTFDASGKLISIANPGVDSRNRQLVLDPTASADENQFNLTDKSFNFRLLFKQTGRPDMKVHMIGEYAGPR